MYDGFLDSAHVPERCAFEEQGLDAVAVQLNGLGAQVEGPRIALAVEAVASRDKPPEVTSERSLTARLAGKLLRSQHLGSGQTVFPNKPKHKKPSQWLSLSSG